MKSTSLVARCSFALATALIPLSLVGCGEAPTEEVSTAESAVIGAPPEAPPPPDGRQGEVRGHVGSTAAGADRQVAVFWDCHYGIDGRPGLGWMYICTSGGTTCSSHYVGGSWGDYSCN